jgi:diguanylate cyclase (GGDEF)-like protein/PAS domain S-box-containing protein
MTPERAPAAVGPAGPPRLDGGELLNRLERLERLDGLNGLERLDVDDIRREILDVHARLADSEETLRAIRHGEVDALVVGAVAGEERLFTLASADLPYRRFVESMSDGAATVSEQGLILYANQALADLVNSTCRAIVGTPFFDLVAQGSRPRLRKVMRPGAPAGSVEAVLMRTGGQSVPVLVGASAVLIEESHVSCVTVTDLTTEREAEAAVAHSAQHDALTGLPNRTLLIDRVRHALARRVPQGSRMALLFCDVDGFKNVNDAYGHQVGDAVLRAVANRLTAAVRPGDTVARIGGDEFVVLCEDLLDVNAATLAADRVRLAAARPLHTDSGDIEITISIGLVMAEHGEDTSPDTLLRDSDEAMYKAKRQGPNSVQLFDDRLRVMAATRLTLLSELRHATTEHELRLAYQPIVDLETERLVGMEALIRWQHPQRGMVQPDDFVPFAERSGLIIPMGAWVLREACVQGAEWAAAATGFAPLTISVNVSGRQLVEGAELVESVHLALETSGLDPTSLCLEVTESALMDDAEAALRVVNEVKALGVRIAIDDFGTGYSSLLYLKRFPVDLVKIDRAFVAGLGVHRDDTAIVRSVIDLAHAFDITAVAEGIETAAQLEALRELQCHFGQGFLWGAGRTAAEFDALSLRAAPLVRR